MKNRIEKLVATSGYVSLANVSKRLEIIRNIDEFLYQLHFDFCSRDWMEEISCTVFPLQRSKWWKPQHF